VLFRSYQEPNTPPEFLKIKSENGIPPLVVVDGIITDIDVNKIDPETIKSITVLKNAGATNKYGDKGKDGVMEITTKKKDTSRNADTKNVVKSEESSGKQITDEDVFVVVEELPEFPGGGKPALAAWITQNIKYPAEAVKDKITGKVFVDFIVNSKGKIINIQVDKPVNPLLDAEAKRVVSSMPDWKPGTQAGKTVPVQMMVPVEFKLK
jgi:TonB family protein